MAKYEERLYEDIESEVSAHGSSRQTTLDWSISSEPRQSTLNNRLKKEEREAVVRKIGRFLYANGLPFNVVNSPYWKEMLDAVGAFGKGLKNPSMYELRTRVLKTEVESIDVINAAHKASWEKFGCTIMTDGWSNQKNRSLINFLVNSPKGTFFYKSIDVPTLQRFAIRVLSLSTSVSDCECNWSTFEQVHSKRKNCLEQKRLHSFVYVMYNMKLNERNIRRRLQRIDPICVEEVQSDDEWIVEAEGSCFPGDHEWLDIPNVEEDFLEVTAINNQSMVETTSTSLKRQKVDVSSSSTQKDKAVFVDEEEDDFIEPDLDDARIGFEDDDDY